MIGLLAVMLLIALASAILGSAHRAAAPPVAVDAATNLLVANDTDLNEPLVDLGVAPSVGNDQAGSVTP